MKGLIMNTLILSAVRFMREIITSVFATRCKGSLLEVPESVTSVPKRQLLDVNHTRPIL